MDTRIEAENTERLEPNSLVDLFSKKTVPNLDQVDLVAEIEGYRQAFLTFIQTHGCSALAECFPMPDNTDLDEVLFAEVFDFEPQLVDVDKSDAGLLRSLKTVNNLLILIERAIPLLDDGGNLAKARLVAMVPQFHQVITQLDTKANSYMRHFLGYMHSAYHQKYDNFQSVLPQLTQYIKSTKARWGSEVVAPIELMMDKIDSILINVPDLGDHTDNKALLERLVSELYPDFSKHIDDKDDSGLYNLRNDQDNARVRLVKAVANSLDLHSRFLMTNPDNAFTAIFDAIASAKKIQSQLWSIECSAAVHEQASDGLDVISAELERMLPVVRAFVKEVIRAEDELYLKEDTLFDHIKPWVETFLRIATKAGIELDESDQDLFFGLRQSMRQARYTELMNTIQVTNKVGERIEHLRTLLSTSKPLGEFVYDDLLFISANIDLLHLPPMLSADIKNAVSFSMNTSTFDEDPFVYSIELVLNQWDRASNLMGNGYSTQIHAADLADSLTKDIQREQADLYFRAEVLAKRKDLTLPTHVDRIVVFEQTDLEARTKAILDKNIDVKQAAIDFREHLIINIKTYCADPIVQNLERSFVRADNAADCAYTVHETDSADVTNLKIILNTLYRLEGFFEGYRNSYWAMLYHGNEIRKAVTQIKVNAQIYHGKYQMVGNILFNTKSDFTGLYGNLLTESRNILHLRDPNTPVQPQPELPLNEQVAQLSEGVIDFIQNYAEEEVQTQDRTAQEDYQWLTTELLVVEEQIFTFLHATFRDSLSQYLVRPQGRGFYEIDEAQPHLITYSKHLLNALHCFTRFAETRASDPYNLKLLVWLGRINQVTLTLAKIDLQDAHEELQVFYKDMLGLCQKVMNDVTDPIALKALVRADELEAFGFKPGTISKPIQYAIEQYQIYAQKVGLKVSSAKQDGMLGLRMRARHASHDTLQGTFASLNKSAQILRKLNRIAQKVKESGYTELSERDESTILRQLDILGFEEDQHDALKSVLNGLATPEIRHYEQLVSRIETCFDYVTSQKIEVAHQIEILEDHQQRATNKRQSANELRDYIKQANAAVAAANSILDKGDNTPLDKDDIKAYNRHEQAAQLALDKAKGVLDVAKSFTTNKLVGDAELSMTTLHNRYGEWFKSHLSNGQTEHNPKETLLALMFAKRPSNIFELIYRFFEAIIVLINRMIRRAQSSVASVGNQTTTEPNTANQNSAEALGAHGLFAAPTTDPASQPDAQQARSITVGA